MEDTLEVYTRPRDPVRPVICLDETSKQLTRETRTPLPRGPGREERIDYEYERAGVANLFMLFVHAGRQALYLRSQKAHRQRLCPCPARTGRRAFPFGREDHSCARQSQHPQNCLIVQGIPTCRGPPHRGTHQDALHPKTWVLAQYSRMRTRRTLPTMPRPAHP